MGKSAHAMLQAFLQDDVDPATLAELALGKMRSKRDLLEQALTGLLKEQHRFLIREHLDHITTLDQAIVRVSNEIAERMRPFEAQQLRCSHSHVFFAHPAFQTHSSSFSDCIVVPGLW